jgi:preprotein translocase subunit YajC
MTLIELLPFAAIAVAFWLLIIRPQSQRRKAQAALVASLAPGQRIMTTAGVFGTVVGVEGDHVRVEVAPGVVIELLALAVAQVVAEDGAAAPVADSVADGAQPEAEVAPDAGDPAPADPSREGDRG